MPTTFKNKSESLADISRKNYGTENSEGLIRDSNPSESDESEGVIFTPSPIISPHVPVSGELTLSINGKTFSNWISADINRSMQSVDTFYFKAPLDLVRDIKPFGFDDVVVFDSLDTVFSGTVVSLEIDVARKKKTATIGCYSRCGVLMDCMPSPESQSEFKGLTLNSIAEKLCSPHGVSVSGGEDQTIKKCRIDQDEKVFSFLSKISRPTGHILKSKPDGSLLIYKPEPSNSVGVYAEGENILLIGSSYDTQRAYSSITAIKRATTKKKAEKHTLKTGLESVNRPYVFFVSDSDNESIKQSAESERGIMYGGIVSFDIKINSWGENNSFSPSQTIDFVSESLGIKNKFKLMISSVTLSHSGSEKTATAKLVMPESFTNKKIERLPWDS